MNRNSPTPKQLAATKAIKKDRIDREAAALRRNLLRRKQAQNTENEGRKGE